MYVYVYFSVHVLIYMHVYKLRLPLSLALSVDVWEGHPSSLSCPLQVKYKADSGPVKLSGGVTISSSIRIKPLGAESSFGRWKWGNKMRGDSAVRIGND